MNLRIARAPWHLRSTENVLYGGLSESQLRSLVSGGMFAY